MTKQKTELKLVGGLFVDQDRKGSEYLSGKIEGVKYCFFRNVKKADEGHPDWKVYKVVVVDEAAG